MARLYRRRRRIKPLAAKRKQDAQASPDEARAQSEEEQRTQPRYNPRQCEGTLVMDMLPPPPKAQRPKDKREAQRQADLEIEYFKRGNTLFGKGLYDEALKKFNTVLKMTPDDPDVNFNAGLCYQYLGKHRAAVKVLLESLRGRPRWGEAWFVISLSFLKQEMLEEAAEACCYAIKDGCKQEQAAFERLGRVLWAQKRLRDAADVFEDCLKDYPENPVAHYFLGQYYYRKARLDRALVFLEKATKLSPKFVEAWNALGRVQCLLGLVFDALPSFEQALKIDGRNKVATNWKNFIARMHKGLVTILPAVFPPWKAPDTPVDAYVQVGLKLMETGNYEFAVGALELAIQQIPDNPRLELWYALAAALTDQFDIAMDTWQRLHEDAPADKRVRLLLAYGCAVTCRRKLAQELALSVGGKTGESVARIAGMSPVVFDQPWSSPDQEVERPEGEEDEEESSVVAGE